MFLCYIQYNTVQYKFYCQLPIGGFSETNINSTGNQNKQKKFSRIADKQLLLLWNYLHIEFMTSQIDYSVSINY